MKAVHQAHYGSLDGLRVTQLDRPAVGKRDVLVKVHAAGLHIGDSFAVRGSPWLMRVETGWRRPKYGVPGFDVAGKVEAIGDEVTRIQPGDEVFGTCKGSCAAFVATSENTLAARPSNLTAEQAATLPTSGLAALHAMRDVAKISAGQHVLVNGASGGVGSIAVQIAKSMGAEVTGVCSDGNAELVRSLGADHVIAYDREDFTLSEPQYDVIFDNIENRLLAEVRRPLKPSGMLILNSGTGASGMTMMVRIFKPLVLNLFTRQKLRRYLSVPGYKDLQELGSMAQQGTVKPVIDRVFPLDQTADAIRYIETGHVKGKVAINAVNAIMPDKDPSGVPDS